ncbi:MAG: tryptophan--tRNA ligase [Holosporales bacterium]|jgi:tryptophanyl-tRNA synthetase|nr:tryptophan--tRNA ligase [Holosporales bacterium]
MQLRQVVLTGDRPTGRLHLGHYVGSLKNRVALQAQHDCFVMIADTQALTDNFDDPKRITESVVGVCKDYLAVGIDPMKSTVFIQSMVPELFELTSYFLNLVSVARLERNPTVKSELQQKGFADSITAGFLCYPVSQAADITAFKATLVPVGDDQLPLIEVTNEIVRRFNRIYCKEVLVEAEAVLSNIRRLVGIDGQTKACKSLGNAIFLSDPSEVIRQKINSMYTDPNHVKVSDPGRVEGNVVFAYLDAFLDDKSELDDLKSRYRRGGLGDTVIKSILNDAVQALLAPIRDRMELVKDDDIKDMLREGSERARTVATHTVSEVRDAIGFGYDNCKT